MKLFYLIMMTLGLSACETQSETVSAASNVITVDEAKSNSVHLADADVFVGHWVDITNPKITLKIERNGQMFIYTESRMGKFSSKPEVYISAAQLKDGVLVREDMSALTHYDAATGNLLVGSSRFVRQTN